MSKSAWVVCVLLLFCVLVPRSWAQDSDLDGVTDNEETLLLSTLAPVVYGDNPDTLPPLPIAWYVRHCRLVWHAGPSGAYVGDTGNTTLDISTLLGIYDVLLAQGQGYHFRLHFRDSNWSTGNDPSDPMSWSIAQAQGSGIYGRVERLAGTVYFVQYYMAFGFNNTTAPDICDVEPGTHEGDWIALDFIVDAADLARPRIVQAIYHNHGRQVFVESSDALRFEGTHPVVYLEQGSNEPWCFAGEEGFRGAGPPSCVSTNEIFPGRSTPFGLLGGEGNERTGDYPAVRLHRGNGPRLLVTSVVNIGSAAQPTGGPEGEFFHRYAGWYGNEYYVDCASFPVLETEPPTGPRHNGEMWNAHAVPSPFPTARVWPSCVGSPRYVAFGAPAPHTGSASLPFSSIHAALGSVYPGGAVICFSGVSPGPLSISAPCTITATGGPVTIGQ